MEHALILCRFVQFAMAMLLWAACLLRPGPVRAFAPRTVTLAALGNLLAALGWLAAEAALAGDGPQDAVNPDVLWALLNATRFGHAWLVHLALAVALVLATLRYGPRVLATCAGLNLASLALTGHAVLPAGPLGVVHQVFSALHLLAAGFWVGGLVVILPALTPTGLTAQTAQVLRRFSVWGHLAVALVFATGLAKSVLILAAREGFDPARDYLTLLLIKVAAVVLMLGLALINRYRFVPGLATPDRARALRLLRRGTLAELVLVVVVLALVSVLATLSPFADV